MSNDYTEISWHDSTAGTSKIKSTQDLGNQTVEVEALHLPMGRYRKIEVHIQNEAERRTSVETSLTINNIKAKDDVHQVYTHHEDLWHSDSKIYSYTVSEEDRRVPTDIVLKGYISSANLIKGGGATIILRGYFYTS
ncbi:hypothetical protein M2407_005162 [Serratia sp. BIGb0234]|uniref:hypothetical protein n=1 Tax=Serratia sp. BIGb0234 TaxID=2940614 RepID=UPI002168B278|nr:hypothetical protein [Serratia sp. BIGb0234]MCS4320788.1 hypothetical protein [Serratia sp. BIGb0234]